MKMDVRSQNLHFYLYCKLYGKSMEINFEVRSTLIGIVAGLEKITLNFNKICLYIVNLLGPLYPWNSLIKRGSEDSRGRGSSEMMMPLEKLFLKTPHYKKVLLSLHIPQHMSKPPDRRLQLQRLWEF